MTEDIRGKYPAAFPKLMPEQMKAVTLAAECKTYYDGDILYRTGETEFKFYVVHKGEIEIIDRSGKEPRTIIVLGPNDFTGDIANLIGRESNVDAVARGTAEVYEICSGELRELIKTKPEISDTILYAFISRGQALRESEYIGLRIIGSQYSVDTFRIRDFLDKNHVIYTFTDTDTDPDFSVLLESFGLGINNTPVVSYGDKWLLSKPLLSELAEKIGLKQPLREHHYDLAIIGAGPAGLAAAVYGASEGLKTVVLEAAAPGGQAGTSSKIENYLGFPIGISGSDLASRAILQSEKFGAQLSISSSAKSLEKDNGKYLIETDSGEKISTSSVLIASGAVYRKLGLPDIGKFEGSGVYYAATEMEATLCSGQPAAIAGGGNSAGQAAVFLASRITKVYLIVRGSALSQTMSNYLSQRISETYNIELLVNTEITGMFGDKHLHSIEVTDKSKGEKQVLKVNSVFSFIGATPNTGWLPDEIERDERGFLLTGYLIKDMSNWNLPRPPFMLETSMPGIFAAGDVRSMSVKRVASAVGEGSMTVQFVHEYLKNLNNGK